jgi:hypothetical protein
MSKTKSPKPRRLKADMCAVIYDGPDGKQVIKEYKTEWRTVRLPKRLRGRKAS